MLIYIHKEQELDDVERRYPAAHYVLVDDKLRILTAIKQVWGERVTTVFPRQGHYALDPDVAALSARPTSRWSASATLSASICRRCYERDDRRLRSGRQASSVNSLAERACRFFLPR